MTMPGGIITSPTSTSPDQDVYYPGTEALGADEMRVITSGSGLPTPRQFQAAVSAVDELCY